MKNRSGAQSTHDDVYNQGFVAKKRIAVPSKAGLGHQTLETAPSHPIVNRAGGWQFVVTILISYCRLYARSLARSGLNDVFNISWQLREPSQSENTTCKLLRCLYFILPKSPMHAIPLQNSHHCNSLHCHSKTLNIPRVFHYKPSTLVPSYQCRTRHNPHCCCCQSPSC